jgi:hypothetical protein
VPGKKNWRRVFRASAGSDDVRNPMGLLYFGDVPPEEG